MGAMSNFKLADSVSMRLVQIFQEAMMMGIDGADLLRQVRLQPDESDPHVLVLDPEYERQVKETHAKYEAEAQQLAAARRPKLILGGDGSDNN